ncbi:class I SAM-dependent methyltransferase [Pseudomonadota bacterium]|nr:class I SAM-dependent methyltransferase [Pseudomonadota bacterium]
MHKKLSNNNKNHLDTNSQIWDSIYKSNNSILSFPNEHFVRLFYRNLLDLGPNFLDWGIGSGNNASLMTLLGKNVFGTEVSEYSIKLVHKLYKKQFNKKIQIDHINNNILNFKNNFFDCIVSWQVQCYNDNNTFKNFLNESYRCLKPNGLLVFTLTDPSDIIFENSNKINKNTYICNFQNQKGITLFALEKPIEISKFIQGFSILDIGFFSYELHKKQSKHWVFCLEKKSTI